MLKRSLSAMERHEGTCFYNPKSSNCYFCVHSMPDPDADKGQGQEDLDLEPWEYDEYPRLYCKLKSADEPGGYGNMLNKKYCKTAPISLSKISGYKCKNFRQRFDKEEYRYRVDGKGNKTHRIDAALLFPDDFQKYLDEKIKGKINS